MENLKTHWHQLNLSNEEDTKIIVNANQLTKDINKGKTSIIGRLHAERAIRKKIIQISMMKMWKLQVPARFWTSNRTPLSSPSIVQKIWTG